MPQANRYWPGKGCIAVAALLVHCGLPSGAQEEMTLPPWSCAPIDRSRTRTPSGSVVSQRDFSAIMDARRGVSKNSSQEVSDERMPVGTLSCSTVCDGAEATGRSAASGARRATAVNAATAQAASVYASAGTVSVQDRPQTASHFPPVRHRHRAGQGLPLGRQADERFPAGARRSRGPGRRRPAPGRHTLPRPRRAAGRRPARPAGGTSRGRRRTGRTSSSPSPGA